MAVCALALFLVYRASRTDPSGVRKLLEAQATLTKEFGEALARSAKAVAERDEWMQETLAKFQDRAWDMHVQRDVREFVRIRGLRPFFQDVDSMVGLEIEAIAKNLGVTREQAIAYMRSRVEAPVNHGEQAEQQ